MKRVPNRSTIRKRVANSTLHSPKKVANSTLNFSCHCTPAMCLYYSLLHFCDCCKAIHTYVSNTHPYCCDCCKQYTPILLCDCCKQYTPILLCDCCKQYTPILLCNCCKQYTPILLCDCCKQYTPILLCVAVSNTHPYCSVIAVNNTHRYCSVIAVSNTHLYCSVIAVCKTPQTNLCHPCFVCITTHYLAPTHICNYTTEHIYHSTQLSYQKHPENLL